MSSLSVHVELQSSSRSSVEAKAKALEALRDQEPNWVQVGLRQHVRVHLRRADIKRVDASIAGFLGGRQTTSQWVSGLLDSPLLLVVMNFDTHVR